ncbi:hypothetical protein [Paradevosia shaoguanensis]|uniref:hypothetical protein n=1 Tax=Paradevosia shaoguanensis TaxID=1335043 RepID=UPI003642D200
MAIWIVRATWVEDETDASEQWEVNAATAQEAMQEAALRMRFQPHHVEVRRQLDAGDKTGLAPGQARHRPAR